MHRSEFEPAMAKAKPRPAAAILLLLIFLAAAAAAGAGSDAETTGGGGGMVGVHGTRFVVGGGERDGRPIYFSGFNAYWLMLVASDPARRGKVVAAFRQAADHGLNLARTWAFSDGGDTPLQAAPGVYDEAMFQGLDFVVAEARRHGIYLLLCLTNNFHDFGGKRQYVQWARDAGHRLATDDDFFNSTVVKDYYKNHVKTVLTRVNTLTGVAYKDDPTILGWELMNEPRCDAEPTGAMVQAWVEEMAPYVKSIDGGHLVTAGLEGFYGAGAHESKDLNPWGIYYGTNFVETHRARGVDFATIHLYPDVWLWGSAAHTQLAFLRNWTRSHARDTELYLGKPLLVTEYGKFLWEGIAGANRTQRDYFLRLVLDSIYASAARGGPLVGGAFWQLLDGGMDTLRDGYEIILPEDQLAATIIGNHSRQLAQLSLITSEDVEKQAALRRRRRSAHRKIHVGSVGGPSGSDSYYTQTQQLLHILLVRFISLFTSISSLFSSV
ncbi:mannan endo-1,4-beta-mannosidase 3-like [Miscanthus floridulus]|uniref:mannan endo-1,4-beta-mannosidase 3-like n=1 Tax=Miscanthus floridulus TaxID=154761 RepID=UPI00345B40CF